MSKPKYTPGPWWVEVGDTETSVESQYFTIASNVSNNDADIIAAAPELLESLKWLTQFCCLGDHDKSDPAVAKVYDAIAKAEGREND